MSYTMITEHHFAVLKLSVNGAILNLTREHVFSVWRLFVTFKIQKVKKTFTMLMFFSFISKLNPKKFPTMDKHT